MEEEEINILKALKVRHKALYQNNRSHFQHFDFTTNLQTIGFYPMAILDCPVEI